MMTELERARFLKVCAMMASPHDNEALTALRKANQMLDEAKLTWGEVILPMPVTIHNGQQYQGYSQAGEATRSRGDRSGAQQTYRPPQQPPEHQPGTPEMTWRVFSIRHPDIANWILLNRVRRRFAASLYDGVMTYGSLTKNQIAAVRRNL